VFETLLGYSTYTKPRQKEYQSGSEDNGPLTSGKEKRPIKQAIQATI
jgi:hypothetical protein